jgi:glycosyltransferase involved in cell wall biosynthesis
LSAPSTIRQTLFGAAAAAASLKMKTPEIIHIHGDYTEALPVVHLLQHVSVPKVLTVHGRLNLNHPHMARATYPWIDAFIALGAGTASDLVSQGVPQDRVTTMSSGIDLSLAESVRRRVPKEPGKVIAVGSLIRLKNFDALVEAFQRMGCPENRRLVIIGEGPEMASLRSAAGGDPTIQFTGSLPREQVYEEVAAAQLFVIPSRRLQSAGEGVSTALLEAMALDTDCLVSTEAIPEPVITDPRSYQVFDPLDSVQLSRLLEDSLVDPESSQRRASRALIASSNLSWRSVADKVDRVYDDAHDTFARRCRVRRG